MKRTFNRIVFLVCSMLLIHTSTTQAQLLVENFEYSIGAVLTTSTSIDPVSGWLGHSGSGTNNIPVVEGLTLSGYAGSGIGGAARLNISGQDINKTFAPQSTGSVYVAFLARVESVTTTGDYFLNVGPSPIGNTLRGRVFVRRDAANKLAFGISHAASTPVLSEFLYDLNVTYLMVLRYTIIDGATNDQSAIFISPLPGQPEPTVGWITATDTGSDIAVGSVALRQGAATHGPVVVVDGIRVATIWADAVAQGVVVPPIATPTITVTEVTIPPLAAPIGTTDQETFTVSGQNLTDPILISLDGTNPGLFTLSTTSIAPVNGTVIPTPVTVTYAPIVAGSHSATLTISSTGASSILRTLTATATDPSAVISIPAVIITEVYGGGGNTGSVFTNDFVELFNTSNESVNIGGWSLHYHSASGTGSPSGSNAFVFPPSVFIPAQTHFLVQAHSGGTGSTVILPTPDAESALTMSASSGKVILYNTSIVPPITDQLLSITGNPAFVDYVPYGTTAVPVWGSSTATLSTSTSAQRKIVSGVYVYTQNIGSDFEVKSPSPQHRGITSFVKETTLLPISVVGQQIRVTATAGEVIEVFNSVGQQVYRQYSVDGINTLRLNERGMLIVKVGNRVSKVIL